MIHEVFSVVFDEKVTAPLKLPKNIHKAPCTTEVRAILFMVGLHKGNFFSKIFRRIEHGCNRYETDLNLGIVSVGTKIGEGEFFHTFLLFLHQVPKRGKWTTCRKEDGELRVH